MTEESSRINFLLKRDGEQMTRNWVVQTVQIYREAIDSPSSHASSSQYKLLFEKAVQDFEQWLKTTE